MLEKPIGGWTRITLGEWSDRASYLDDVPMMLLDGFIKRQHGSFLLEFDAEGWDYFIIFDWAGAYIIDEHPTGVPTLYVANIRREDLAKELVDDIESDFYGWLHWEPGYNEEDDEYEEYYKKREITLREKIAKIREIYSI